MESILENTLANKVTKVAIIGKPNVGKSSLFNKLCAKKLAIINETAGTTRDIKSHNAKLNDLKFELLDTAGWEIDCKQRNEETNFLHSEVKKHTSYAIDIADVIIFMLSASEDINPLEVELSHIIRKSEKPVILMINKSELKRKDIDLKQVYKFGFGDPIYISVSQNLGFLELYDKFKKLQKKGDFFRATEFNNSDNSIVQLAICGRPNVGKSTFFNKILNEDKSIVSDVAGTTRDAINSYMEFDGTQIEIIDTAGMRKKNQVKETLENASVVQSITAIRRAQVVILMLEAKGAFEKQDIAIGQIAVNEGKALIVVVNKFDLVDDKKAYVNFVEQTMRERFPQIRNMPIFYISALTKNNFSNNILTEVVRLHGEMNLSITTGKLNKWLRTAVENHTPPLASNGIRVKLKYITQIAKKPPTFKVFLNIPKALPDHYKTYLRNDFYKSFNVTGIPLRFEFTKTDNPYV